jgi:hypothetical protein
MQGTLKGICICHGDPVYIKHQGRVAGGLVGSLSRNCDYSVRLRVSGVWADTNIGVHRTSRGYFYLEFPRERVLPGPRVSGIAHWIMSGAPLLTDPGFAEWFMVRIILPLCDALVLQSPVDIGSHAQPNKAVWHIYHFTSKLRVAFQQAYTRGNYIAWTVLISLS